MNCSQFKILLYAFKLALLTSFQSKYSFDFAVRAPAQNTRAYSQTVAGFCYIQVVDSVVVSRFKWTLFRCSTSVLMCQRIWRRWRMRSTQP